MRHDTSNMLVSESIAIGSSAILSLGVLTHEYTPGKVESSISTLEKNSSCVFEENIKNCILDVSQSKGNVALETYPVQFDKTVFCFDDMVHIRLRSKLVLKQTDDLKHLIVTDWNNAEIPFQSFSQKIIEADILRFFQEMYVKSSIGNLSENDKKTWLKMLRTFDYQSFSQEMSPAMYDQGEIRALNDNYVTIVWSGDKRQTISTNKSIKFKNGTIRKGDRIGAMVKRSIKNEIVSIDDIVLLPKIENVTIDWEEIKSV